MLYCVYVCCSVNLVQSEAVCTRVCVCVQACMPGYRERRQAHWRFNGRGFWISGPEGFWLNSRLVGGVCARATLVHSQSDVCDRDTCLCPTCEYVKGQGMMLTVMRRVDVLNDRQNFSSFCTQRFFVGTNHSYIKTKYFMQIWWEPYVSKNT